jgi:hypothetical protein
MDNVGDLTFELVSEGKERTRSIEDPTVLAAVIGAGATSFAAVIGIIGLWLSNRNNKPEVVIEIKMTKEIAQILLASKAEINSRGRIAEQAFANNTDSMILSSEQIMDLSEEDRLFFDAIPESKVDYVSILEDL